MRTLPFALALTLSFATFAVSAAAQDWPHWRGPRYDGSTQARDLPTRFDKKERVVWATELPGPAACTPIVVGKRVFLSSTDPERERLVAMCLDRDTGEVLWRQDADSGYKPGGIGTRIARGHRTTYASPSPATDGERVVFFFGNGDLVCYDFEGEELWRRNLQKDYGDFAFQWTFSASPVVVAGKVFLPVLQRDVPVRRRRGRPRGGPGRDEPIESYLMALDPRTGKTLYRHVRPTDARLESRESYATPIPWTDPEGRLQILVVGGDVLTGHDPETGEELWRWGTWNPGHRERWWRLVPSVVVGRGIALVCAPKRAPVYAIDLARRQLAWRSGGRPNPVSSDVPTPAYHDRHFYVLSDVRSALSKVEAETGEIVWTTPLPREFLWRASPTVADGKVYLMNHGGEVFVVAAEDGGILHRAAMGEEDDDRTRSSIVVAHGCLFIRTNHKLFCVK